MGLGIGLVVASQALQALQLWVDREARWAAARGRRLSPLGVVGCEGVLGALLTVRRGRHAQAGGTLGSGRGCWRGPPAVVRTHSRAKRPRVAGRCWQLRGRTAQRGPALSAQLPNPPTPCTRRRLWRCPYSRTAQGRRALGCGKTPWTPSGAFGARPRCRCGRLVCACESLRTRAHARVCTSVCAWCSGCVCRHVCACAGGLTACGVCGIFARWTHRLQGCAKVPPRAAPGRNLPAHARPLPRAAAPAHQVLLAAQLCAMQVYNACAILASGAPPRLPRPIPHTPPNHQRCVARRLAPPAPHRKACAAGLVAGRNLWAARSAEPPPPSPCLPPIPAPPARPRPDDCPRLPPPSRALPSISLTLPG